MLSSTHQDDTLPPEMFEMNNSRASDRSLQQNISALMDKIHTLQGKC